MQRLINQFNQPETLVVITSYPPKNGEAAQLNAVACYAGNLLKAYKSRKIVVLAEALGKTELYRQGNVLVYRCFDRDSFLLYWHLLNALHIFHKPRQVLVQFEFNMLGIMSVTGALPLFLGFLRALGRQIIVVQHQVVGDLGELEGHLGIKRGSIKSQVFNLFLNWFYRALGFVSHKIIVHEEVLKACLGQFVPMAKIAVVSHGLSLAKREPLKALARQKLGFAKDEFILLLFGYLTWYKGTDWLIKKVGQLANAQPELKLRLVVAGGPSATLAYKRHYKAFLQKVQALAAAYHQSVMMTGFIPDKEVGTYFAAADLAVLPYRTLMSASGPLSFALRFGKPFLVSQAMLPALRNKDVRTVVEGSKIKPQALGFGLEGKTFDQKIALLASHRGVLKRLERLSKSLAQLRTWPTIVNEYEQVLASVPAAAVAIQWRLNLGRILTGLLAFAADKEIAR
jgi:glycosyltransferase involved in cell wall biosynthesis